MVDFRTFYGILSGDFRIFLLCSMRITLSINTTSYTSSASKSIMSATIPFTIKFSRTASFQYLFDTGLSCIHAQQSMSFSGNKQGVPSLSTAQIKNRRVFFLMMLEEFNKFRRWLSTDIEPFLKFIIVTNHCLLTHVLAFWVEQGF